MSQTTSLKGRSELGFAALLAAVAGFVALDARSLDAPYSQSDTVGPATMPWAVAGLLGLSAIWLVVDVVRGGQGEIAGGEDVDLSRPSDWRVVLPLAAVFMANVVLVDRLGWVISGALLFAGSVWAMGSRHLVRDIVIGALLGLATFYGFRLGLGIPLPSGILEGVL